LNTATKFALLTAIFVAGFLWLATCSVSPGLFGYDEADYAFDAGMGLAANYTDSPTLPLPQFLREGLGRGKSASERGALSEAIRNSNDIIFYRHWHGPLYFYFLIPATAFTHDEHTLRTLGLAIPILSFLVIALGCLWLTGGNEGWLQAILCSALFLWSWTTLGSTELAPHQLFACCCLLGLFFLAKMAATGRRRFLYAAAFAAGLAFCTLEVTFVLVATIIVVAFLERRRLALDWSTAFRALAVFVATVFVLWPGAILKLSFVKAYLFMAYLAIFRKSPWGNQGLLETWITRFQNAPLEWLLIAVALGLFVFNRGLREKRTLYPFLIFAGLMIVATLRVTTGAPRYALPFMPALQVFTGLAIATALPGRPRQQALWATLIALALFAASWIAVNRHPPGTDPTIAGLLNIVRADHLQSANLLVPQDYVPPLHYYFPHTHLRGYTGDQPADADLAAHDLTGVLYLGNPVYYQPNLIK
jgi:hypothetical protein